MHVHSLEGYSYAFKIMYHFPNAMHGTFNSKTLFHKKMFNAVC